MAITEVKARAFAVPVSRPTRISTRALNERHYLVVEVSSAAGDVVGLGYAYAGTNSGLLLADIVTELLGPILAGQDEDGILALWDRMYQETLLVGRRGAVLRAMSAVDIALWDLSAKLRSVSLATLLGGQDGERVGAYASGGYYRADDGDWAAAVVDEIKLNTAAGFRDHKIKVGGLSLELDCERVAAAVAAMDAGGRLALDANNAYRNVPEALRACRALEAAAGTSGLWWIEEPLPPDDIRGHARLVQELDTTIATGEIHQTRWDFRDLIEHGAADLLQPDVGVVGGVSEWLRVARLAEVFGIQVAPHWHANVHAQLAAATPNCLGVEHFMLEKDIYNFELLLTDETRLRVDGGYVKLDGRPGIGIELDPQTAQRFEINR